MYIKMATNSQLSQLDLKNKLGTKAHHNYITQDKERILKAAREKETVSYEGVPIRLSADFSKETL